MQRLSEYFKSGHGLARRAVSWGFLYSKRALLVQHLGPIGVRSVHEQADE